MSQQTEIRDGMRIDWDVPITMDDGVVLRADVYRPPQEGKYPVILSYGPYANGLAFQEGYPDQWQRMATEHPDVVEGSTNKYHNWEVVDPEKWVPDGYVCVRVDSQGCGPFLHDDRENRPQTIFGGKNTLYAGGKKGSYVFVPIIPKK